MTDKITYFVAFMNLKTQRDNGHYFSLSFQHLETRKDDEYFGMVKLVPHCITKNCNSLYSIFILSTTSDLKVMIISFIKILERKCNIEIKIEKQKHSFIQLQQQ